MQMPWLFVNAHKRHCVIEYDFICLYIIGTYYVFAILKFIHSSVASENFANVCD